MLNLQKCQFFKDEVEFLGYRVRKDEILPMRSKVQVIQEMRRPRDVGELHRFLGMTGYYRAMVQDYSMIAAPLTKMT